MLPLLPLLLAGALAAPAPACAVCSCMSPGDAPLAVQVEDAASSADAVFTGRVVRVEGTDTKALLAGETTRSWDRLDVVLVVGERWKGEVGDTAVVTTSLLAEMCGVALDEGEEYLVYAWRTPRGELATGSCSRTARTDRAEDDLRVLAELRRTGVLDGVRGEETESP